VVVLVLDLLFRHHIDRTLGRCRGRS
jgi:hypothetical protein